MTETIPADTAIEPERLLNEGRVDTERLTLTHENDDHYRDHCETDAIGRAIVGVTDADDRLLLVVDFENGHAACRTTRLLPTRAGQPSVETGSKARRVSTPRSTT